MGYPVYSNGKRTAELPNLPIEKSISIQDVVLIMDIVHEEGFYFPGEAHPFWEMVYVVEGIIGVSADDRLYTLSAGDLIFHKPMEYHKIWTEGGPAHVYIYSFSASGEGLAQLEHFSGHVKSRAAALLQEINAVSKQAFLIWHTMPKAITDTTKAHTFFNLLEIFLLEIRAQSGQPPKEDNDAILFSRVVNFLKENLDKQLSVDEIAQSCNFSKSVIKKTFGKYADMGVITYFNMLKVKKAMELLDEGNSVLETSEKLGFSNQFYFSTVFKKQTGYPPSKYRK